VYVFANSRNFRLDPGAKIGLNAPRLPVSEQRADSPITSSQTLLLWLRRRKPSCCCADANRWRSDFSYAAAKSSRAACDIKQEATRSLSSGK